MAGILAPCPCGLTNNFNGVACPSVFKQAYGGAFVPYFTTAGAVNGLDLKAAPALNAAYFTALVSAAQAIAWRPLPPILDFKSNREARVMQEFNGGNVKLPVSDGNRSGSFILDEVAPIFKDKLDNLKDDWGLVLWDKNGNIMGVRGPGYKQFYPIRLQRRSIYGDFVLADDKTRQNVMCGFTVDPNIKDSDLCMIPAEDLASYDIRNLRGLIDAEIIQNTNVTQTATAFGVVVDTLQGDINTPMLIEGLVVGDFTLVNQTTGASVVITSVTEVAPGYYSFVVPALTAGVKYKLNATTTGFNIIYTLITGV